MATAGASCATHYYDHRGNKAEDYNEMELSFDPALASCCERDENEYNKAMKLKAVLTAHDPTSGGVRMRQQLFQLPPVNSTLKPQSSVMPHEVLQSRVSVSDSDDFDDSDDEFGMETKLAMRRKQLEQQFQKAAQDAADGYGMVLDSDLLHLVQELQDEPHVPRVALVVDRSASMKPEFMRVMRSEMAAVAHKYVGTKFYVAMAARGDEEEVLRQLRLPIVSSLAAFSRGELVSSIALDPTTLVAEVEVLWEARFLPWLTKCCVLTSERHISQHTSRSYPSRRKSVDEDEKEQLGFDCGKEGCRLRFEYEHEHVGTSQQTKDEIAAWRQALE